MRKFIRHPSCIPVEISVGAAGVPEQQFSLNVSAGGLAYRLLHPVEVGSTISIRMPQIWPDYVAEGCVVWCRETASGYEAGVQFPRPDEAFKARMVEQFCQIEDYRKQRHRNDGALLSSEEAAKEWLERHGADFAATVAG